MYTDVNWVRRTEAVRAVETERKEAITSATGRIFAPYEFSCGCVNYHTKQCFDSTR